MARLEWYGPEVEAKIQKGAERGIDAVAKSLVAGLKLKLGQPGSGRWYKKKPARSSAPGEPPVAQTGRLRRSIQMDVSQIRKLMARVGTNVKYAPWLELGTSRMRPRPYMRPTLRLMRGRFRRIIFKWVESAIRTA